MSESPKVKLNFNVSLIADAKDGKFIVRTESGDWSHESEVSIEEISNISNLSTEDQLIMMAMNQLRELIETKIKIS